MKCQRATCQYISHTNKNNNGGTHCCFACKDETNHGPLCQKMTDPAIYNLNLKLANKYKYVVSLTTIPSRFDNLHLTIDSLLEQTLPPLLIIINIPTTYHVRFTANIHPEKIKNFREKYTSTNVIINLIPHDYGPGSKLLGLFHLLSPNVFTPDTYIILVDDDMIYKSHMIEYFDIYMKPRPPIELASYYVYSDGRINIGQGADGFFIRQELLKNFTKYYYLIKDKDYVSYHDDYYISYYFYLINKTIHFIHPPQTLIYTFTPNANSNALVDIKGKYQRYNLDNHVYDILNRMYTDGAFNFIKDEKN